MLQLVLCHSIPSPALLRRPRELGGDFGDETCAEGQSSGLAVFCCGLTCKRAHNTTSNTVPRISDPFRGPEKPTWAIRRRRRLSSFRSNPSISSSYHFSLAHDGSISTSSYASVSRTIGWCCWDEGELHSSGCEGQSRVADVGSHFAGVAGRHEQAATCSHRFERLPASLGLCTTTSDSVCYSEVSCSLSVRRARVNFAHSVDFHSLATRAETLLTNRDSFFLSDKKYQAEEMAIISGLTTLRVTMAVS